MHAKLIKRLAAAEQAIKASDRKALFVYEYERGEELPEPPPGCRAAIYLPKRLDEAECSVDRHPEAAYPHNRAEAAGGSSEDGEIAWPRR